MNRVNGCLWRTHNLWHTARTVEFDSLKAKRKRKPYPLFLIKYSDYNLFIIKIKMIHYQKCINEYSNWLLIKCLALSNVLHSEECIKTILLIRLMAVCDEHIIYQLLHALLCFELSQDQKKTWRWYWMCDQI